jgi:hypothetical protein
MGSLGQRTQDRGFDRTGDSGQKNRGQARWGDAPVARLKKCMKFRSIHEDL